MPDPPVTPSADDFAADLAAVRSSFDADLATAKSHVSEQKPVPHPVVARLLDWLPTAGMIAGGALGEGIGSVPLAAGGGVVGESLKQQINRAVGNPAPTTVGQALTDMAIQGGIGGATEGGLQVVKAVAKPLASSLMRSSIKPSVDALKATGELEQGAAEPGMVKAALESGGSVTPEGVRTLGAAAKAALDAKNAIIANLSGRVSPSAVAQTAQNYADGLLIKSDKKAAQKVIDNFVEQYVRDPQTGQMKPWLDPSTADTLKTQYRYGQDFNKLSKPAGQARKVVASGLRSALEALDTTDKLASANSTWARTNDALQATARANALWQNQPMAMRFLKAITGKSPAINSLLANGLYDRAALIAHVPVEAIRAASALLSPPEN